jgi:hypothetical protein
VEANTVQVLRRATKESWEIFFSPRLFHHSVCGPVHGWYLKKVVQQRQPVACAANLASHSDKALAMTHMVWGNTGTRLAGKLEGQSSTMHKVNELTTN